jgi:hypothetical protein
MNKAFLVEDAAPVMQPCASHERSKVASCCLRGEDDTADKARLVLGHDIRIPVEMHRLVKARCRRKTRGRIIAACHETCVWMSEHEMSRTVSKQAP